VGFPIRNWPRASSGYSRGPGELPLDKLCQEAYASFSHPAVVPLVQLDHRTFALELFHGPTLAFKDMALQLLGPLFDHVLTRRGERVTIVGATSAIPVPPPSRPAGIARRLTSSSCTPRAGPAPCSAGR
jgi:hypothetical protein